ncbi:MAG: hypothetical protein ACN4EF_01940 [Wenyingzhuangia sp.]|jgi:hypothetical protein|uniref:hypothetical protein n=1 Tax=Wenyingzhuangia sp. TaxID=1964193 RepID=UPI00321B4A81
MKKIYKAISILLHPIFLPMFGSWLYLTHLPLPLSKMQIYLIFFLVVGCTFLLPLLMIFFLKFTGRIKSIEVPEINDRKLPVILMFVNYLFLALMISRVWQIRELTILVYAIALGLIAVFIFLYFKIKASLHLLGMTSLLGFAVVYGVAYQYSIFVIALLFMMTGVLATVRLKLKAHNFKEIIIGSILGFLLPILTSLVL